MNVADELRAHRVACHLRAAHDAAVIAARAVARLAKLTGHS